jgi:hypothetical protein
MCTFVANRRAREKATSCFAHVEAPVSSRTVLAASLAQSIRAAPIDAKHGVRIEYGQEALEVAGRAALRNASTTAR